MTTWLHGTAAVLRPGDVLKPGKDLGRANTDYAGNGTDNPSVYITNDPETAKTYARTAYVPGQGFGDEGLLTKDPHVYVVEPLGSVQPDPHEKLPGGYFTRPGTQFVTPQARVVREVKVIPNRNAIRRGAGLPVLPDIDPPRWEVAEMSDPRTRIAAKQPPAVLYHGTDHPFAPGDRVLPGEQVGKGGLSGGPVADSALVWMQDDVHDMLGTYGERIFEVQPEGEIQNPFPHVYASPSAVVVREVTSEYRTLAKELRRTSRVATPSWRDRGHPHIEHQYEAVIASDKSREGRRFMVSLYGQPHARRSSLAEAKQTVEEVYGPLQWEQVGRDTTPHHDPTWGDTTMFNDAGRYYVVRRLPRLGVTAGSAVQAERIWGHGINALFPVDPYSTERDWQGKPIQPDLVAVPWPINLNYNSGGGRKNLVYDQDAVNYAVENPLKFLDDVDPRTLTATQNFVTYAGVAYYVSDQYRATGEPWKDQHQAGNRYPVIFEKANGARLILSGTHRAAAALVSGKMLHCLMVKEDAHGGHHAVAVPQRLPTPAGRRAAGQDPFRGGGNHLLRWASGPQGHPGGRGGRSAAAGGQRARGVPGASLRQASGRVAATVGWGYEQDLWRPHSGMFAPGKDYLDPRVFDADQKMRGDTREYALTHLDQFWTPLYGDWTQWARVYLCGSGASYWWDSDSDLDFLIGVDLDRLRQVRPANREVADEDILAHLNKGLIEDLRPQMATYHPVPGMPEMEVTFYCNPHSWDIEDIHPYAAYDVTNDLWVQKPPVLPANWGPDSIPEETWLRCEMAAREAEQVLGLPEPERTIAGAVLFNWIHEGRQAAYSANGGGWLDPGNVIYQYLSLHPHHYLRRLYLCKHPEQTTDAVDKAALVAYH